MSRSEVSPSSALRGAQGPAISAVEGLPGCEMKAPPNPKAHILQRAPAGMAHTILPASFCPWIPAEEAVSRTTTVKAGRGRALCCPLVATHQQGRESMMAE